MIATWMVYAILIGCLVALAAQALERAARANRIPTRFIWMFALIVTVIAPFAVYAAGRVSPAPAATSGGVAMGPAAGAVMPTAAAPLVFTRLIDAATAVAETLNRPVAIAWALLTIVLLSRIAYATVVLWRRQREWIAREIDGVPLFVTPDLGPAVVALPASRILVPRWLLALDPAQIATVLRHEREHHVAGDARLLVAASVLSALLPWNGAIWWQTRRLRLAIEMDCDARVLRNGPRVDHYGALLLAIAQHPRAALHAAATLTESTSDLERRIDAMTTTPPSAPRIVAATCGAAALIAIFVACAMPAPDVVAGPTKPEFVTANKQMSEFEVEAPARPVATTMPPEYPAELRAAGVGGVVVAKFVVDTNGRPDMATFLIVKSDHSLFGEAVREAMPEMEFVSAEVGGRRVRQLMQMPFIFSLSREDQTALMDSLGIKRPGPTEAARATPTPVSHPRRIAYPTTDPATAQPTFVRELTRFGRPARAAPRSLPPVPVRTIYRQGDTIAARALPTNAPPAYPAELRAAGIEGEVTASFVVRSDGRVDLNSFETVKSNHPLFSKAVKSAVPQMEFRPATVNGTAVDWVVTMPFVFSLAK